MKVQRNTCEKVRRKGLCKCDKCRVYKADKWLISKRPSLLSMCYQFRKAFLDKDQATLEQLHVYFENGRCLCCGYTLLHLAVNVASKQLVDLYLSRDHDVGKRTDNGETALHMACDQDDSWFAERLIEAKADVNAIDSVGCTALQICLSRDVPSAKILTMLVRHGARPNNHFRLGEPVEESIARMIKANERTASGLLPLYEAVQNGDYLMTQQLLEDGACPNSLNYYRRSLLQLACFNNSLGCAEALVNAGADVDESDLEGRTALHYAIISQSEEIVELLLGNNCNLWITDSDGYTALGIAALTNRWQVTEQLLNHGANCTEILLMEALERQCSQVVLAILRRGFFRVHDTKFGRTLLYCALATDQHEVASYLQSIGVEVAYEGSDDEQDFPMVSPSSLQTSTPPTSPDPSQSILQQSVIQTSSTNKDRYSVWPANDASPASSVSNNLSVQRSVGNCTRKTSCITAMTKKRLRKPSIQNEPSKNLHQQTQQFSSKFKTRMNQQHKNTRDYKQLVPKKSYLTTDRRPVSLANEPALPRHTTKSKSTKTILPKANSYMVSDVRLLQRCVAKRTSMVRTTQNDSSLFHVYSEKTKLTTYKSVCFKSFCKDDKLRSAPHHFDPFFKYYKYRVQYK